MSDSRSKITGMGIILEVFVALDIRLVAAQGTHQDVAEEYHAGIGCNLHALLVSLVNDSA